MTDYALVGGRLHTHLIDSTADLAALDSHGNWIVVIPYEGEAVCARFASVTSADSLDSPPVPGAWSGVPLESWTSSLDRESFMEGVERIRSEIAAGNVYQVNLTRRLSAPLPDHSDIGGLAQILRLENPAPHQAVVSLPELGIHIASASPERFIERRGSLIRSSPIKGTAATATGFLPKDTAENVMIVDLVRNDLGRICEWGSVDVSELLAVESHPGVHHMVSTIEGNLRSSNGWAEIIDAAFPAGSITGAPKLASLDLISALEPTPRGVYCGAIGWVDADRKLGDLNVAIRTFWIENNRLNFGTGGGITFDSSPSGEWEETQLKAARLLSAASQTTTLPGQGE
ncbi:MAG: anthranilate synthase component I family protein [Microthrixaceae bacterium]|nr:anthranilate synthase component I family protein [Microthrixaceae bacterium]